jgi:hypothetical protein
MAREIDILLQAASKGCAVVEKVSHVLWTREEFLQAREADCFPDEDRLAPPTDGVDISGPFPGCLQQFAAPADLTLYRLVGQTEHFLIFVPPGPEIAGPGRDARAPAQSVPSPVRR